MTLSYLEAAALPQFNDENDPDGEGWNAYCERQGELAAEAKASAWFDFPGDRY